MTGIHEMPQEKWSKCMRLQVLAAHQLNVHLPSCDHVGIVGQLVDALFVQQTAGSRDLSMGMCVVRGANRNSNGVCPGGHNFML